MKDYCVWRRCHSMSQWICTSHSLKARTDKEAQAKTKRKFTNCGFSSMSLLAVERGITP